MSELSPEQVAKRQQALASPWAAKAIKWMARGQVKVFRLTNGRIGS